MLRRIGLIVLLGVVAAQAGHLLTYQLLFGAAAQHVQSTGAHSYFPALVKTVLGAAAAIALGVLLLVGVARILRGRIGKGHAPSYLRLLAALFTIQLAVFASQEAIEAIVSGQSTSIDGLLLMGSLGQLPVAALAAFAIRFLLVEVVPALGEIRLYLSAPQQPLGMIRALAPVAVADVHDLRRSRIATSWVRKRGPPSF